MSKLPYNLTPKGQKGNKNNEERAKNSSGSITNATPKKQRTSSAISGATSAAKTYRNSAEAKANRELNRETRQFEASMRESKMDQNVRRQFDEQLNANRKKKGR